MKYNGQMEIKVRESMKLAITTALQEALGQPLHVRVLSSQVAHEELLPEGDLFNLKFRVTVHPRKVQDEFNPKDVAILGGDPSL